MIVNVVVCFVLGTIIAGQINHAIYRFAFFNNPPISPWMKPHPDASRRSWIDFIPVVGWTTLNREESIHGSLFWLRPILIEITWGFGVAWLYVFHCQDSSGLVPDGIDIPQQVATQWSWFAAHLVLFSLLAVATFIDFDEFMIPDQVTIPGVLVGVIFAACFPNVLLPTVNQQLNLAENMTFASPLDPPAIGYSPAGLCAALGALWFWCFALVPKVCTFRLGVGRFFPLMVASILQRPRANKGNIEIAPRRMYWGTPVLFLIAVAGTVGIIVFWLLAPDSNKAGLLTSMLGMAFGMSMIWSIRVIGRMALGKEAMGFGDVTLMAMIGAFVGWQACLPILAASALIALIISVPMAIAKSENTLPYGPYLSMGTVLVVLGWSFIWEGWQKNVFETFEPQVIFLILVGMTVPMFVLLLVTRFVKERLIGIR